MHDPVTAQVESAVERARALHRIGRLAEAGTLCRGALQLRPRHFDALNLLGIIAAQSNDPEAAVELFGKAILANRRSAVAHNNQGNALRALGRHAAAVASYDRAIALERDYASAYANRGNALRALGRHAAALESYDRAIALDPSGPEAHYNRGNALYDLRRHEAAVASYDRAIALQPAHAAAHNNRGNALRELRRREAALESYERATALRPDYAEAHHNRGLALADLGQYTAALASYDQAIALRAGYADAWFNRGNALRELERYEAAAASYLEAMAADPRRADARNNLGNALAELQQHEAAVARYDEAVALRPDYAEAWYNRGNALRALRRHEAAAASYDRALELAPDFEFLFGMRLHARMQVCDWSGFEAAVAQLQARIERDAAASDPFSVLALLDSPPLQRRAAELWARRQCPPPSAVPDFARRAPGERIRIGYFSADFRNHPVSALTAELIETHDRSRFEITAFSFGPDTQDEMRRRMERAFERFLDVRGRTDRNVAELARSVGIDIAVDLGGFTRGSRPRIFALRAAPVQVSYLGYLGTMAVDYMDYLIADATIVPAAQQRHYSERIAYLPSYQPNDSGRRIAERRFARAELGLPPAGFVFCCLNACYKITPGTFASWMRILRSVDGSVLLLLADGETARSNLRMEAVKRGVDASRLVFGGRLPHPEYLARYRAADLFLDTLPYNAGTTASDALWSGLPVLTLRGEAFAARVGASLLEAVGLPELIASSREHYEALAVDLAARPRHLADLREQLARNRLSTRLFDIRRYARHLEAAYLQMQARHDAGLPPETIRVEDP